MGGTGNVVYDQANQGGREALSGEMMSYWASFARSGDPGRGARGELPAWDAWNGRPQGHKFMILDTEAGGGLRMGSEPVTVESVLASVESDPRLTSQRDRCRVYRELAAWGGGFGREDYPAAGREGCAEYPFDTFPWE
jgi:para-nitrobenzyl esterase